MKRILCGLLLAATSCGSSGHANWRVARDPTWFPNQFPGKEVEVTAFSDQLIQAIGKEEGMKIDLYPISWSFLHQELLEGRVDGALTSTPPVAEYLELFDFSKRYLATGAVLVVTSDSHIEGLDDVAGQKIGITLGSPDILIIAPYGDVTIAEYPTLPEALLGLWRGEVDGILIPAMIAYAYCRDIYAGKLKVVTPPLTGDGLRLMVKKGKSERLIKDFDRGLEKVKHSSTYQELLEMWGLNPS